MLLFHYCLRFFLFVISCIALFYYSSLFFFSFYMEHKLLIYYYCLYCYTFFIILYFITLSEVLNYMIIYYYSLVSIEVLVIFLLVIFTIAFMTLYERKVLASIQQRKGPNIVGWIGLLQAFADAFKLIIKESIVPLHSIRFIFIISPLLLLTLSLFSWSFIPFNYRAFSLNLNISLLCLFAISSLSVYNIIGSGWASNSKYSFLGSIRASAQFFSYELVMSVVLLCIFLLNHTLQVLELTLNQEFFWYIIGIFPLFILFFIASLAETNRPPFDFPEAESELVSGYNVEYSAITFAFFFLSEYGYIFLISNIIVLSFFGGWSPIWFLGTYISYGLKIAFFLFLFIWIRGTVPRYRYDQLMVIGWLRILPLSFFFFIYLCIFIFLYDFTHFYFIFCS